MRMIVIAAPMTGDRERYRLSRGIIHLYICKRGPPNEYNPTERPPAVFSRARARIRPVEWKIEIRLVPR